MIPAPLQVVLNPPRQRSEDRDCPHCGTPVVVCFADRNAYVECPSRSCLFTQSADRDELRAAALRTYRKERGL